MAEPRPYLKLRLFISYSHRDEASREELGKCLEFLNRNKLIEDWHDRKIVAGEEWGKEINKNLDSADVILLLVSPDFLTSEYILGVEMKKALEKHDAGDACVIPIIVRPADWNLVKELARLQALPKDAIPVTDSKWPNKDVAWKDVSDGVLKAVKKLVNDRQREVILLKRVEPRKYRKRSIEMEDYRLGAEILCGMVERHHGFDPDLLIAVNQGGMAMAAVMNKHWRKPVGIMYTTIRGNAREVKDISLPCEIKPSPGSAGQKIKLQPLQPRSILVVDPKLKTGESAESIRDILQKAYGQDLDIRYAIFLAYGGWAQSLWKVLHPTPYEWPIQFRPRDLRAYIAYYTDLPAHDDKVTEVLRP